MRKIRRKEKSGAEIKRGRPASGKKPETQELLRLYVQESRSIREIAEILGCKKDTVHYWLKKYDIPARTMAKRSKLLKYSLSELKEGVEEKGIRGYARELGVNASTLSRFLKSEIE
jgi:transposase-like protein